MSTSLLVVESEYDGPRMDDGDKVSVKFAAELMAAFKAQKKLHKRYAYKVLE